MRSAASMATIAAALLVSRSALAAVTLEPSNPLASSPWSFTFENPAQASSMAIAFTMDDGGGAAIAVAGGPVINSEIFYLCRGADCFVMAWNFGANNAGAARFTFSPPVTRAAIQIQACIGSTVGALAIGPGGTETLADAPCVPGQWISANGANGGLIDELILRGDQVEFDELSVDLSALAGADLALAGERAVSAANATVPLDFTTRNLGPGEATSVRLDVLPEPGIAISPAAVDGIIRDVIGTIAELSEAVSSFAVTAPEGFDCHSRLTYIGLARSNALEPNAANNIAVGNVVLDRSQILPREDCAGLGDEDCDGFYGCADADCRNDPQCAAPITIVDISNNNLPWDLFPLPFPPFVGEGVPAPPAPAPDTRQPPPRPSAACTVFVNGEARPAPAYCCQRAPHPGEPLFAAFHRDCPPRDPNEKEAEPAVGGNGIGFTSAAERIRYTLHYENIGATDAHDVAIIDVLSEELDDSTLEIEGEGVYDPATRTLTWIDPAVFPSDPREVRFSIAVRADAPLGTRVRNHATIVFPDAVPPTRIDTNAVEHVIPHPEAVLGPQLFVAKCTDEGNNRYRVHIENRGLEHAYNVSAVAVEIPGGVEVNGTATFAHEGDPAPDEIATVMALFTTPSRETIEIRGASSDPCPHIAWEIRYRGIRDADETVTIVRALVDPESGGGCCSTTGASGSGSTLLLAFLVVLATRRRRYRQSRVATTAASSSEPS